MKNYRAKEMEPDSDAAAVQVMICMVAGLLLDFNNLLTSSSLQEFLANMETAFAQHPLWQGSSRADLEAAAEVRVLGFYCLQNCYELQ